VASGVDGFSYAWSQQADTDPGTAKSASSGTQPDTAKDAEETTTSLSSVRPDGSWWFHVRAVDIGGSWSGTSHIGPFRIDTTPLGTKIVSGPPAETADSSATFVLSADEPATFSCSLDGADDADCASSVTGRVGALRYVWSRAVPRGRVVSQRPRPGVRRRGGAKVALVLSRGSKR
jgi:hypothetical protein